MLKHFNYHLTGFGWAEAWFVWEAEKLSFELSYLRDSLSELLDGLIALVEEERTGLEVVFMDEPGEHRLIIVKYKEGLNVKITHSEEWQESTDQLQSKTTRVLYEKEDTIQNFLTIVFAGVQDLRNRHTDEEYQEKWINHEFPQEAFERLKAIISEQRLL